MAAASLGIRKTRLISIQSPYLAIIIHATGTNIIRTFLRSHVSNASIILCFNPFNVFPFSSNLFFQCLAFPLCSLHRLNFNFVSIFSSSPSFRRSILYRLILLPSLFLQNVHTFIVFTLSSYPYFHRLHPFFLYPFIVPIQSLPFHLSILIVSSFYRYRS
jgi:hypothetical protein